MKSEPKTRELHYVETVFLCERCHGESRRVYSRKGKWYCLSCLKERIKQDGGRSEDVYAAAWQAEDVWQSAGLRRIASDIPASSQKNSLR